MLLAAEEHVRQAMGANPRRDGQRRRRNLYTNYGLQISKTNYQKLHRMDDIHYQGIRLTDLWPSAKPTKRASPPTSSTT